MNRKRAYEEKYPETKHGAVGRGGKSRQNGDSSSAPRFSSDTAEKTGLSERSIQRQAHRAVGANLGQNFGRNLAALGINTEPGNLQDSARRFASNLAASSQDLPPSDQAA